MSIFNDEYTYILFFVRYEVDVCPQLPYPTREQILQRISGSDAVLWCSKEKVDSEMLDRAGKKKIVSYIYSVI